MKTNRRDALSLATAAACGRCYDGQVSVPDETARGWFADPVVRTRAMAIEDYRRKRQQISLFLLPAWPKVVYEGGTTAQRATINLRLAGRTRASSMLPPNRFAFQEMLNADASYGAVERDRWQVGPTLRSWKSCCLSWMMAPKVAAIPGHAWRRFS